MTAAAKLEPGVALLRPARQSYLPKRHAPLDGLAIRSLDNAVQLHHLRAGCNGEMCRDIFGGRDDADMFGSAAELQAITPGKLGDL